MSEPAAGALATGQRGATDAGASPVVESIATAPTSAATHDTLAATAGKGADQQLTHFDAEGRAHMVDVTEKDVTTRTATAGGNVRMTETTLSRILTGAAEKGDVIGVARLAGIMAAKRTADLIPLCHPLPLSRVAVDLVPDLSLPGLRIEATVRTTGRTGVEMEALTAVTVAALTVYDMLKAVERGMVISDIRLLMKDGGRSGLYTAGDAT